MTHAPAISTRNNRRAASGGADGFTLVEMMIVMGVVVLMVTLAIPVLSTIRGNRSVDSGLNNLSAVLGQARADAIGIQGIRGVFFYSDPVTGRIIAAIVKPVGGPSTGSPSAQLYLDLDPDHEQLMLPVGISLQMVQNATMSGKDRASEGYIGFNPLMGTLKTAAFNGGVAYGGVVLFDANGQVLNSTYAFKLQNVSEGPPVTAKVTEMGKLLLNAANDPAGATGTATSTFPEAFAPTITRSDGSTAGMTSSLGLVMFDHVDFTGAGFADDDPAMQGDGTHYTAVVGTETKSEQAEETWLDQNGTPALINRYNGTLVLPEQ